MPASRLDWMAAFFASEAASRNFAILSLIDGDSIIFLATTSAAPKSGEPATEPPVNRLKSERLRFSLVSPLVERFSTASPIAREVDTLLFIFRMSAPVDFFTSVSMNDLKSFRMLSSPALATPSLTSPVALYRLKWSSRSSLTLCTSPRLGDLFFNRALISAFAF